ncbi:MAG: hypothetical protein OXT09_18870 [Myxococcales bacterium]|nr:hypothetical protein [Myxococcales bacterium]
MVRPSRSRGRSRPELALALLIALLWSWSATAHAEESGFIPERGTIWTQLAWQFWRADERYAGPFGADLNFEGFVDPADPDPPTTALRVEVGDRVPIKLDVPGATFDNQALFAKLRVVPLPRTMLRLSVPLYQRSVFQQAGTSIITEGTGDIETFIGYMVTPEGGAVGSAFYLHVKIPTTEIAFEDLSVPLSEGQVDVAVEHATSWAVIPRLHLTGRTLFRHRFEAEAEVGGATGRIKPGDEVELGAEVGGEPLPLLWMKTKYQGLWATTAEDRSIERDFRALDKRQIHWWALEGYYRFGALLSPATEHLAVDLKLRYPLGGVDYLRGPLFYAGLSYQLNYLR